MSSFLMKLSAFSLEDWSVFEHCVFPNFVVLSGPHIYAGW